MSESSELRYALFPSCKSVSRSTLEYSGTVFTGLFTPTSRGSCLALSTNTVLTIALSHLLGRGVRLETHEAVALARELMAYPCGIPTPQNIQLDSEGSVSCISTDGVPSVASVAHLLLTLLPAGTPNVPAPLRYAIARGVEAVEAPPFASLGEFLAHTGTVRKGSAPRRTQRLAAALRAAIASDRGADRRRANAADAADAASGSECASGAAAHGSDRGTDRRGAAAADPASGSDCARGAAAHGSDRGTVLERGVTADRCSATDVQVLRRRRTSGLACALIAAAVTGGRGGTPRVVCGGLRRRGRSHRPPCRDKAIRLRARVARSVRRRTCSGRFGCETR